MKNSGLTYIFIIMQVIFLTGCFATFQTAEVLYPGETMSGLQVVGVAESANGAPIGLLETNADISTMYYTLVAFFRMGLGSNIDFGLWGSPFADPRGAVGNSKLWTFPYFIPFGGDIKWQFLKETDVIPAVAVDLDIRWLPFYCGIAGIVSKNVAESTALYGGYKFLAQPLNYEVFIGVKQAISEQTECCVSQITLHLRELFCTGVKA